MYPDWPKSKADLVPLPQSCPGPKLEAFDFGGPQKIEFLEHLGRGLHGRVFKVKIHQRLYALKVFEFAPYWKWPFYVLADGRFDDLEVMSAYYEYADPFNNECRAFARLKDTGHERLAVRCHGYVLLDEEHEASLQKLRVYHPYEFDGERKDHHAGFSMRGLFVGQGGITRPPPLRAIVKELGVADHEHDPSTAGLRRLLQDIKDLQQLGIVNLDVGIHQLINGKMCDFSIALTMPHFATSPELNPHLAAAEKARLELDAFQKSIGDYFHFENMVDDWNWDLFEFADDYSAKRMLNVHAFSGACFLQHPKYRLRPTPARRRVYTFVDPRRGVWENAPPVRLRAKPPLWDFRGSESQADLFRSQERNSLAVTSTYIYKDGLIYPRARDRTAAPPLEEFDFVEGDMREMDECDEFYGVRDYDDMVWPPADAAQTRRQGGSNESTSGEEAGAAPQQEIAKVAGRSGDTSSARAPEEGRELAEETKEMRKKRLLDEWRESRKYRTPAGEPGMGYDLRWQDLRERKRPRL